MLMAATRRVCLLFRSYFINWQRIGPTLGLPTVSKLPSCKAVSLDLLMSRGAVPASSWTLLEPTLTALPLSIGHLMVSTSPYLLGLPEIGRASCRERV